MPPLLRLIPAPRARGRRGTNLTEAGGDGPGPPRPRATDSPTPKDTGAAGLAIRLGGSNTSKRGATSPGAAASASISATTTPATLRGAAGFTGRPRAGATEGVTSLTAGPAAEHPRPSSTTLGSAKAPSGGGFRSQGRVAASL
jgi:hypothetical protein